MLHTIHHGTKGGQTPLLLAHGLFGSARNWGVIAKRLSDEREVVVADMRNHGHSPWHGSHSYPDLADDLAEVIRQTFGGPVHVMGHSMGGKAAMMLALKHPSLLASLAVADIAPVAYTHSQQSNIDAMRAVDLSQLESRAQARAQLEPHLEDKTLAAFFTQSLDVKNKAWLINLETLAKEMPLILGFPDTGGLAPFESPALFLSGAMSDYVLPEHRATIKPLFPKARFAKIPDAGHWLHAEKPREFEAALRAWLNAAQGA